MLKTMNFCNCVLILFFAIASVKGLYFYLSEGELQCFLEDVPEHTTVTGYDFKLNFDFC
jgi:hypothetical protein